MSFPRILCEPRTDVSFRCRDQPEHHRTKSYIENLPIDMVKDFIIADSLHLFHLGSMRRLLRIWTTGEVNKQLKLSKNDISRLDSALLKCNQTLPSEIHRSVRSIESLKFWKGSELSSVLLYVGVLAFRNILRHDIYEHFLILFCAVRICSSETYSKYLPLKLSSIISLKSILNCTVYMLLHLMCIICAML